MTLSEEQIKRLLEWFVTLSKTRKKYSEQRKQAFEENHKWIQPKIIQKMSDGELEAKFREYFNSGGGRQSLNPIYRDRIIRDKKVFRKTILYLLDEKIDIKKRIEQIFEGSYRWFW